MPSPIPDDDGGASIGSAIRPVPTASLEWPASTWRERQQRHEVRVDAWISPRLKRRSRGHRHPVYDFLFDYYSYRPSSLRRWHPGFGVKLLDGCEDFGSRVGYRSDARGCVEANIHAWKPERRRFVPWLQEILKATAQRAGFFGCAGLHEWAMVYADGPQRHHDWPLRLSQSETDAVVHSLPLRCSHFDAFRFFTPEARPLNRLQLARLDAIDNEQPGCLHANMDLYKWGYKLAPFTSSELVADSFELAMQIREIDMRASPYDFSALGFQPILIETPEGRADYERHQRGFAAQAAPLRAALIKTCRELLSAWDDSPEVHPAVC